MDFFRFELCVEYFPKIIQYLPTTLKIALVSAVFGILIGLILALVRIYHLPVLEQIAIVLTSFLRATPPNVLLLMIFFAIPFLFQELCMTLFHFNINRMDLFVYVTVAYSVMNSAFFAEMFRGAVSGVDKGQTEAAYAIGLTRGQAFRRIVFPQAIRIALPEFGNILINILKNTSLACLVGIVDLMGAVNLASIDTFHPLEGYVDVTLIYFMLSLILERAFEAISVRANRYT
ncbi:MAG: amino acid ABC transporter permease [Fusicatenibacter sp.]|nr:amino acid ABC transporter permease [Fusicatenibacter sp.]